METGRFLVYYIVAWIPEGLIAQTRFLLTPSIFNGLFAQGNEFAF